MTTKKAVSKKVAATNNNSTAAVVAVAVEQPVAKPVSNIFDKAVVLVLEVNGIGNRRKVSTSQIEVEADKNMIGVTKRLFESEEYDAIKQKEGEIRRFIYSRALPSYFRNGTYLVPNKLIVAIDEKLIEFKNEREQLIAAFIEKYDAMVKEAKSRLRELYNPADYQSSDVVRAQFAMDWQYVSFGVPGNLEGLNAEMFAREKSKAEAKWAEATEAVQDVLRANMKELVDHLLDRLSGGEDGAAKTFKNSTIDAFNDFLSTFEARNITDDAQLQELVSKAKSMLDGVDAKELRASKIARKTVTQSFAEIKQSLDKMIVDKPKRAISFEEV